MEILRLVTKAFAIVFSFIWILSLVIFLSPTVYPPIVGLIGGGGPSSGIGLAGAGPIPTLLVIIVSFGWPFVLLSWGFHGVVDGWIKKRNGIEPVSRNYNRRVLLDVIFLIAFVICMFFVFRFGFV
ncbi:MAG: hypothetical protein Q7S01_05655 [bacterium]|nr:hypothetical protein [bacterium]